MYITIIMPYNFFRFQIVHERIAPSYHDWSPYVGASRAGHDAVNTEHLNASSERQFGVANDIEIQLTEDKLIELREDGTVWKLCDFILFSINF